MRRQAARSVASNAGCSPWFVATSTAKSLSGAIQTVANLYTRARER